MAAVSPIVCENCPHALRSPSYPQAEAVHLADVEVRVVIRDQARPLPAATDRPSLSQRCGAISRRGREQVEMELRWSKSVREPISDSLNHCATGVGRGTKDVLALMPTRMLGVVCGLLGHPARDGGQEIGVMRQVGRAKQLAAASSMLLVLGACSDGSAEPGNEPTATSTTTSPTPADTETSPPSQSEVASQAAEAKVREYYDVRDQFRLDPTARLSRLRMVATSVELDAQQRLFKRERSQGVVQTGHTRIAELVVQSVNLDNSDPRAGRVPTVQVDVCYDVSGVDMVDADGNSIVSADRPDRGWVRHSVSNYEWDTDRAGSWRVASSETLEQSPCAAS